MQAPLSQSSEEKPFLHLPLEITTLIVSFISDDPHAQSQLHALTLVSRSFYSAAIARLYHSPQLHGHRFELFVRTVCPSINSWVKQNGLGDFTVRLDLSRLVHEGSKSITARLIGRLKGKLEFFSAPQASFRYAKSSPRPRRVRQTLSQPLVSIVSRPCRNAAIFGLSISPGCPSP